MDVDTENGGVALLLSGGQTCTAVLLDNSLGVQYSGNVPAASHILRAADGFYLLTDSTVECFNKAGEFQWTQPMDAKAPGGCAQWSAAAGVQRQYGAAGHGTGAGQLQCVLRRPLYRSGMSRVLKK